MKVATFTKTGTKATTEANLSKAVFEREINHDLLKAAYLRLLANQRQDTAKTKTRGLIRGGGKKPWRQKGTGRARSGSIRNPLWRGGGTIFGPTGEQNHAMELPKKALRASIAQALSTKASAKAIIVIEAFDTKDGKVKTTQDFIAKLGVTGNTLLVLDNCDALAQRATGNLSGLTATSVSGLTTKAVLDANTLVITTAALGQIDAWLGDNA